MVGQESIMPVRVVKPGGSRVRSSTETQILGFFNRGADGRRILRPIVKTLIVHSWINCNSIGKISAGVVGSYFIHGDESGVSLILI
jgi:hypothetical protein